MKYPTIDQYMSQLSHPNRREGGIRTLDAFKAQPDEGALLVSVITVVFNGEQTIEQTIKSLLAQSYNNIEYIIIDGGSTDGTLDIIRKYENNISYWISEPDKGIYDAMNKGVSLSNGKIVALLNADDYYSCSNSISLVVNSILFYENAIYYGDAIIQYDDLGIESLKKGMLDLTKGMTFSHQSMFVCKDVYEKNGLYNTNYKYAADFEFALRMYLLGIQYVYLPHPLVNFRYGASSDKYFHKSYSEVFLIIYKERGFIYSMRYTVVFLKSICLRLIHQAIRKIFGESAYLRCKKMYVVWRENISRVSYN